MGHEETGLRETVLDQGTKCPCLAVVQDVQHLHKPLSVPSLFFYGKYFLLFLQ